jgi:hypothetical protein
MGRPPQHSVQERARITFELADLGVELMRQNLRRRFPGEGEEAIERRLIEWLRTRPGAEHGDAWGRPSRPDPDAILRRAREKA